MADLRPLRRALAAYYAAQKRGIRRESTDAELKSGLTQLAALTETLERRCIGYHEGCRRLLQLARELAQEALRELDTDDVCGLALPFYDAYSLREALKTLPQRYLQVLEQRYKNGLSWAGISARSDLSPGALRGMERRALTALYLNMEGG